MVRDALEQNDLAPLQVYLSLERPPVGTADPAPSENGESAAADSTASPETDTSAPGHRRSRALDGALQDILRVGRDLAYIAVCRRELPLARTLVRNMGDVSFRI